MSVYKNVAYTALSKRSEEVLLMTCRVEVMTSDGSVTPARALLDSAAPTSLNANLLANKLHASTLALNQL